MKDNNIDGADGLDILDEMEYIRLLTAEYVLLIQKSTNDAIGRLGDLIIEKQNELIQFVNNKLKQS